MTRPVLYVFSENNEVKNSISRYVSFIGIRSGILEDGKQIKLKHKFNPRTQAKVYSFIEEITSILDKESPKTLLDTAVIVDCSNFKENNLSHLDPLRNTSASCDSNSTEQIIPSLILAYPEIYWIFLCTSYNKPPDNLPWTKEHIIDLNDMTKCISLLNRHQNGYRPLFDPSGLRTSIKLKILEKQKENEKVNISGEHEKIIKDRNENWAVAMDEELPYTFINGYTAYRFGYRCNILTSKAEMNTLKETAKGRASRSFEDVDLRFADISDHCCPTV
jgi:hypothetical protein